MYDPVGFEPTTSSLEALGNVLVKFNFVKKE